MPRLVRGYIVYLIIWINYLPLIIFAGIVAELPAALVGILEAARTGAMSTVLLLGLLAGALGVIALIVYVERAQRRLLIQYLAKIAWMPH